MSGPGPTPKHGATSAGMPDTRDPRLWIRSTRRTSPTSRSSGSGGAAVSGLGPRAPRPFTRTGSCSRWPGRAVTWCGSTPPRERRCGRSDCPTPSVGSTPCGRLGGKGSHTRRSTVGESSTLRPQRSSSMPSMPRRAGLSTTGARPCRWMAFQRPAWSISCPTSSPTGVLGRSGTSRTTRITGSRWRSGTSPALHRRSS